MSFIGHQAGAGKQTNKRHKGAIKKVAGKEAGKMVGVTASGVASMAGLSKSGRRMRAKQLRDNKRKELMDDNREKPHGRAPRTILLVPLTSGADVEGAGNMLYAEVAKNERGPPQSSAALPAFTSFLPGHKQRVTVVRAPGAANLMATLDLAKVADMVMFVIAAGDETEHDALQMLAALRAQAPPAVMALVQGLGGLPGKTLSKVKKAHTDAFLHEFADAKVLQLDTEAEAATLVRLLRDIRPSTISWRDARPFLLTDAISTTPDESGPDGATCTVSMTGYLRGANLSANSLVHVPGFGDFQIARVDAAADPVPAGVRKQAAPAFAMEAAEGAGAPAAPAAPGQALHTPDPSKQQSLMSLNIPDLLNMEQTWPTEEEMAGAGNGGMDADDAAEDAETERRKHKKLMKKAGGSSYQAAWIVEDGDYGSTSESEGEFDFIGPDSMAAKLAASQRKSAGMVSDDDDDDDAGGSEGGMASGGDDDDDDDDLQTKGEKAEAAALAMDDEEALTSENLRAQKEERQRALQDGADDDVIFTDEKDTPEDQDARKRFDKFRGLKSFKESLWDKHEGLPPEYGCTFSFQNLKATQSRVQQEAVACAGTVEAGQYVTVHLAKVPSALFQAAAGAAPMMPTVLFGLFEFEHKLSVVHMSVRKCANYEPVVRSKQPMVVQCGFRRFPSRPIFSQASPGSQKHKYERYLHGGSWAIASAYSHVTFPPSTVLLFNADPDEPENMGTLVATGNLATVSPDRIILKRIVLTGFPIKVHKKTAVIRYMFYNPEDVKYFKPVQLHTKYGRTGHIVDSVGTHGSMKCQFDRPMTQMDTVCMPLYKRVYPKWPEWAPNWLEVPKLAREGPVSVDAPRV